MTQFYAFIIATNYKGEKVLNIVDTTMRKGFATEKMAASKMNKHIKNNFAAENVILTEVKALADGQAVCDYADELRSKM